MLNYPIKRSWTKKSAVVLANSNFVAPASNHTGRLLIPDTRINCTETHQLDHATRMIEAQRSIKIIDFMFGFCKQGCCFNVVRMLSILETEILGCSYGADVLDMILLALRMLFSFG